MAAAVRELALVPDAPEETRCAGRGCQEATIRKVPPGWLCHDCQFAAAQAAADAAKAESAREELRRRRADWRESLLSLGVESREAAVPATMPLGELAGWRGDPWAVTILGDLGTGKSWLAARLLGEMYCSGAAWGLAWWANPRRPEDAREAMWVYVPLLIEQLKAEINAKPKRSAIEDLLTAGVLVLDEIGVARDTPYVTEKLGLVTAMRYSRELPTIYTANAKAIGEKVDPRSATRLENTISITLEGGDRRRSPRPTARRTA